MFVRSRVVKGHTYYQLVHGYRDEAGAVRQKTLSLGPFETVEEALAFEKRQLPKYKRKRTEWKDCRDKEPSSLGRKEFDRWDRRVSLTEAKITKLQDALVERRVVQVDPTKGLTATLR